jgi:hypothetical protein
MELSSKLHNLLPSHTRSELEELIILWYGNGQAPIPRDEANIEVTSGGNYSIIYTLKLDDTAVTTSPSSVGGLDGGRLGSSTGGGASGGGMLGGMCAGGMGVSMGGERGGSTGGGLPSGLPSGLPGGLTSYWRSEKPKMVSTPTLSPIHGLRPRIRG